MLLEKVTRYIVQHRLLQKGDRVLAAVSGGPDSLCLLHLLLSLSSRYRLSLAVAHLDHRIRPEARQEAEKVRRIAEALSLPFEGGAIDVPSYRAEQKLSASEASRIVRYKFLLGAAKKHRATKIALGHQLDDLAETVLLNLLRGTGPDGLAGILPRRFLGSVELIRPLLGITRKEIEQYCQKHRLETILDSSNLETAYTRNRIRLELIPHLEKNYNPRLKKSLAELAVLVAADRAYLKQAARNKFERIARREKGELILNRKAFAALPMALRGRVAYRALQEYIPRKQIGRRQIEQLLSLAREDNSIRQLSLPAGVQAYRSYERLILSLGPTGDEKPFPVRQLRIPGRTVFSEGNLAIEAFFLRPDELSWPPALGQAYLDYDTLPGPLLLRARWPGAYFYPQGAPGGKKLKDFLIDQKVPRHCRDRLPLVVAGDEVVWVVGKRIAHPYRVTGKTLRALVLKLQQLDKEKEDNR